jgi:Ca2+-binding EF-hand superfamily protein
MQDAFAHLDVNDSGTITAKELADAFRAMKIEVSKQLLNNILHLFDTNGDNSI